MEIDVYIIKLKQHTLHSIHAGMIGSCVPGGKFILLTHESDLQNTNSDLQP
jgi:hypothetical protein